MSAYLTSKDCRMPVMDGWVATKMIRAHEAETKAKRIHIVALTADDTGQEAAIRAGMCVFFLFVYLATGPTSEELNSPQG